MNKCPCWSLTNISIPHERIIIPHKSCLGENLVIEVSRSHRGDAQGSKLASLVFSGTGSDSGQHNFQTPMGLC